MSGGVARWNGSGTLCTVARLRHATAGVQSSSPERSATLYGVTLPGAWKRRQHAMQPWLVGPTGANFHASARAFHTR